MPKLKEELATLKNQDTYSLMLFVLFKLRDIPEYSTLSELIYILHKDEFLRLCEYFGGMKIKIPTIGELERLINVLILYQYTNIDKMEYDDAIKILDCNKKELSEIKKDYNKIIPILERYSLVK